MIRHQETADTVEVNPSRPRFSFGLRTMLLGMAFVAVSVFVGINVVEFVHRAEIRPALIWIARSEAQSGQSSSTRFQDDLQYRAYVSLQVDLLKSVFVAQAALRNPAIGHSSLVNRQSDAEGWLKQHLIVLPVNDSQTISVEFTNGSATERAEITNEVVNAYLKNVAQAEREENCRKWDQLDRLISKYRNEYRAEFGGYLQIAEHLGGAIGDSLEQNAIKEIEELAQHRIALQNRLRAMELQAIAGDVASAAAGDWNHEHTALVQQIEKLDAETADKLKSINALSGDSGALDVRRQRLATLSVQIRDWEVQLSKLICDLSRQPRVQTTEYAVPYESPDFPTGAALSLAALCMTCCVLAWRVHKVAS